MESILFYASLVGTAAFGLTFVILALRPPPLAAPKGGPSVESQGGIPGAGELADLADKFGKSGPRATAASLTVFFFTAALVTGGVLDVSLQAGSEPESGAETPAE